MIHVDEITPDRLEDYEQIPIAFKVDYVLEIQLVGNGIGGFLFKEVPVESFVKDYDAFEGGSPTSWPGQFDVSTWGFFLASCDQEPIGAAAVAWNTDGVNMLEGRGDMSVLWDIRVHPDERRHGIGTALFRHAAAWSVRHSCTQMKIETQNVNLAACRFYQNMGCELGDVRRFAYVDQPHVASEIQLNWYLKL